VKTERTRTVGDMLRTDLVTTVEQGAPGILRVEVGEKFHSHQAREYYFTQLAVAYHTWRVDSRPLIIELWRSGRKIGEYTDRGFLLEEAPPPTAAAVPSPETPTGGGPAQVGGKSRSSANTRERSGFHFGLGLGGGAMDFACHGCDIPSETGFSGFLSVAGSVGEKTLVGLETTGWTGSQSGATARVYSVMANATEYLSATSGLFVRAGVGVVGYHSGFGDRSASAVGFSGRLGYELGMGRFDFVPYVGIVRTFGGTDIKGSGEYAGWNVAISNLQMGLSIAAH
jgi:hypothetical protein